MPVLYKKISTYTVTITLYKYAVPCVTCTYTFPVNIYIKGITCKKQMKIS